MLHVCGEKWFKEQILSVILRSDIHESRYAGTAGAFVGFVSGYLFCV